jgi:hypothetical protein
LCIHPLTFSKINERMTELWKFKSPRM